MRQVKIIFIAVELAMIAGFVSLAVFADLNDWMMRTIFVLFALNAVVMQREQGQIEWEEENIQEA